MALRKLKIGKYSRGKFLASVSLIIISSFSSAALADATKNYYSGTVHGGIGLMETRTARFMPDGGFEVGASFINPYRRYFFNWQVFPWMEVTFRYVDPTNAQNGSVGIDQTQNKFFKDLIGFRAGETRLDRGIDVKFKLFSERKYRPAIAIGLQDFIGTGLFAGEYLVANKKVGDFDFSLGLGWGHVGNRGGFPNPMKIFGSRFRERTNASGFGGNANIGSYFSGQDISFFGGVEYLSPIKGLTFKLEFNGAKLTSDLDVQERFVHLRESVPINIGINYRVGKWLDASIAFERGNSIMLRFAFKADFMGKGIKKIDNPQPKLNTRPKIENYETPIVDDNLVEIKIDPTKRMAHFDLRKTYQKFSKANFDVSSFRLEGTEANISLKCNSVDQETCVVSENFQELIFANVPDRVREVSLIVSKAQNESINYILIRKSFEGNKSLSTEYKNVGKNIGTLLKAEIINSNLVLNVKTSLENNKNIQDSFSLIRENVFSNIKEIKIETPQDIILEKNLQILEAKNAEGKRLELQKGLVGLAIKIDNEPSKRYASSENGFVNLKENNQKSEEGTNKATAEPESIPQSTYISAAIMRDLSSRGFWGHSVNIEKHEATIYLSNWNYLNGARNLGWVSKIAANHLPEEIEIITVVELVGALERSRV